MVTKDHDNKKVDADRSELATPFATREEALKLNENPPEKYVYLRNQMVNQGDMWGAVMEHNWRYVRHMNVTWLPKYGRVLVIGAAPSLTEKVARSIDYDRFDAILVTLPMVNWFYDHHQELRGFDIRNVYVVDSEQELFIPPSNYGRYMRWIKLIGPSCKMLREDWPFLEVYLYNRIEGRYNPWQPEAWGRSSGAVALKIAVEAMEAELVNYVGIDLSGSYEQFEDETTYWLQQPHVERLVTE